jgi:hypothetical protein
MAAYTEGVGVVDDVAQVAEAGDQDADVALGELAGRFWWSRLARASQIREFWRARRHGHGRHMQPDDH